MLQVLERRKASVSERKLKKMLRLWHTNPPTITQIRSVLRIDPDEDVHHKDPQCLGGSNDLRSMSIVKIFRHIFWHTVFGAQDAQSTAGTMRDICDVLGLPFQIALQEELTHLECEPVCGKIMMTNWRLLRFLLFVLSHPKLEKTSVGVFIYKHHERRLFRFFIRNIHPRWFLKIIVRIWLKSELTPQMLIDSINTNWNHSSHKWIVIPRK